MGSGPEAVATQRVASDAVGLLEPWTTAEVNINSSLANKGADIGLFFQQVLALRDPSKHGVLLKIHTKSNDLWRCSMLKSLCGSAKQVREILARFDGEPGLGFIGPWALTWKWATPIHETYESLGPFGFQYDRIEKKMKLMWGALFPNSSFPFRHQYLIAAGSTYWARSAPLLNDVQLREGMSRLISAWTEGYSTACKEEKCSQLYALERVLPTMFPARYGLSGEEAPNKSGLDSASRAC